MDSKYIENIECDYIILDEFHRLGSSEWGGTGVDNLLKSHQDCKVLGTSATPIRYLDNMRNMAEEIFNGCYAVNMNLEKAIRRKILPLPVYVTAWYSFSGEFARLEEKAATVNNPYLKNKLYNKIQKAKSMVVDIDCRLDSILHKHITNSNGKYIIFCPNVASLESARTDCIYWFEKVNKNINVYADYTNGDKIKQQFENFIEDTSDNLKVLLCVDMLNEGIHVKDVDGVIMLRSTTSANVFYQQLGRALTCSNKHPVIFDLVNNFETGNTADEYASVMELGRQYNHGDSAMDITFEIYDYVRDIRALIDEISHTFEQSWDLSFEILYDFVKEKERFPYVKEDYRGFRLGDWCTYQKNLYRKKQLSQSRIETLESIGFPWNYLIEAWNVKYMALKKYKEDTGRFPVRKDTLDDENVNDLYLWCNTQRQMFKAGKMLPDRIAKLREIGYELYVMSDDERWEDNYNQLCSICKSLNRFPLGDDIEDISLRTWVICQRALLNEGKLSDLKIQKLKSIGFVLDVESYRWSLEFEMLAQFIKENNRNPKTNEKYGKFCLGQWYAKQINALSRGLLPVDREQKFKSLDIQATTYYDEKWYATYETLKEFISINARFPYTQEEYKGYVLYNWINHQKHYYKKGKLDIKRVNILKDIGIDLETFSVNKFETEIPKIWLEMYNEYADFIKEHQRKPNRSKEEGRGYRWRRRQITALKEERLNCSQVKLLEQINFG